MNITSNSFRNNEYYPYGLPMSSSGDYQGNDYKYGGKEFDMFQKVNIYDFAARTYVPDEGRFWQPDPRAGDYHWLSPYAFCAADPVNKIDPTGEKIYYVNMLGQYITAEETGLTPNELSEHEKDLKGKDCIFVIGDGGTIISQSDTFPEGTITACNVEKDIDGNTITIFQVKGVRAGMNFYRTLSIGYVEWGYANTDNKITGEKEQVFLTTSHATDENRGLNNLVNNILSPQTHRVWSIRHIHPSGTPYPSGIEARADGKWVKDMGFAKEFISIYKQPTMFIIDIRDTQEKIYYSIFSTKSNFRIK